MTGVLWQSPSASCQHLGVWALRRDVWGRGDEAGGPWLREPACVWGGWHSLRAPREARVTPDLGEILLATVTRDRRQARRVKGTHAPPPPLL